MKVKIYTFKYSNFGEKFANGFFSFFTNLAMPIVTFYLIAIGMGISGITKHLSPEIMMALLVLSILLGIIFAVRFICCFKGVVLYDSYLEITTQTLGFGKNRPKYKINYSDIASAFISTYNIRYDRRKARKSFIAGDYSNYVEITLRGGKQFCFTVEDQEEFFEELIQRVNSCKKTDTNDNLLS
ncbi:MAG: hypothetical protein J1E81_07085 [Eubacterium sp.]|nr:hypothetical protein [Eubacterium sp.]